MRLSFEGDRVLAVVAHPDDVELLCAGTLARARDDGAAVGICVMCSGDKGQPPDKVRNLKAVRRREMQASAKLLGAELFWGNVDDSELADTPIHRKRLVEIYRQFRPTLVLAHDARDYHADHRAASALAESATWMVASNGHRTSNAPLAAPPALWWIDTVMMQEFEPGFYIDVSPYMELKKRMLACHKSQLRRKDEKGFGSLEAVLVQQCTTRGAQAGVAAAEAFRSHPAWKRARAW